MTKISAYPEITIPTIDDLLIGTDVENQNETKNFSIQGIVDLAVPYKVYTATLYQNGITAPVATVLQNTLGGNVTWQRDGAGNYGASSSGLFTAGKTTVTCSNMWGNYNIMLYPIFEESTFPNTIKLANIDTTVPVTQIDGMDFSFVEIKVYN
jgi:hypothetical protein